MKKIVVLFLLVFVTLIVYSQEVKLTATVDERTELLGIVFRLAEADEYINNTLSSYSKDIDEYFASFKNHDVVNFAKKVRAKRGVSYDAVMSMAINIEITDSIRFLPNTSIDNLDSRWGVKNAKTFIVYLNQFYRESNFHQFYQNHSKVYSAATENFNYILKDLNTKWFEYFYGVETHGAFNIIVSLTNSGNYGPEINYSDGRKNLYAIMGVSKADSLGNPIFSKSIFGVIVHEFNHSFCNSLVDEHYSILGQEAKQLYKENSELFNEQAYGDAKTVMCEMLVRACVIKYFQNRNENSEFINRLIANEQRYGFLWIDKLVNWLNVYSENRNKYPTLNSFMPEVARLSKELSLEQVKKEYEVCKVAKIVSSNIPNGAINVDPSTNYVVVTFNLPMNSGNNGTSWGKKGKKYFPTLDNDKKASWNEATKMEWRIPVKLKPITKYSLSFPSEFFVDKNGYPMKETYYLDFKTGN